MGWVGLYYNWVFFFLWLEECKVKVGEGVEYFLVKVDGR